SPPASTIGVWSGGFHAMVTSEVALSSESLAVSRTTYVPALSTWIVVSRAPGSSNSTVPGPLILLHVVVSCAGGAGSPSSSTVPCNGAVNHCDCTGPRPAGEKGPEERRGEKHKR